MKRLDAQRLPELEAQVVFAIEEGHAFPGGEALGSGLRASLFLQPAHLQMIPIPATIREAVGASLRPAGLRIVLSKGSSELLDTPLVPLRDIWGDEAPRLCKAMALAGTPRARLGLLDTFLQKRARSVTEPARTVVGALEHLRSVHGDMSTERLADVCGFTSRTLRNLTIAETGLAPKHLARILRIRRALDLLTASGAALSDAALMCAFSDQAHMSREFRELLGAAPSSLRRRLQEPMPRMDSAWDLPSTGLLVVPKRDTAGS
jgi:AraC-like DNA-binding protein